MAGGVMGLEISIPEYHFKFHQTFKAGQLQTDSL